MRHETVTIVFAAGGGAGINRAQTGAGVGMAPEMIPIAMEPFRQVDASLARKFEGTGLGLPLVKTLMQRHDGRLEIESQLNAGTVARLVFPPHACVASEAARRA